MSDFLLYPRYFGYYIMKLWILCNLLIVVGSPPIWGVPLGQVDVSVQLRARPCQNHPSKSGVPTHTALLQTNPVSPLPHWHLLGETGAPICTSLLPPRGDLGSASCWAPLTPAEGNRGSRVPTSSSCLLNARWGGDSAAPLGPTDTGRWPAFMSINLTFHSLIQSHCCWVCVKVQLPVGHW